MTTFSHIPSSHRQKSLSGPYFSLLSKVELTCTQGTEQGVVVPMGEDLNGPRCSEDLEQGCPSNVYGQYRCGDKSWKQWAESFLSLCGLETAQPEPVEQIRGVGLT
jgi:hypothetical protein